METHTVGWNWDVGGGAIIALGGPGGPCKADMDWVLDPMLFALLGGGGPSPSSAIRDMYWKHNNKSVKKKT